MRSRPVTAGAACGLVALATVVAGPMAVPGFAAAPSAQGWWNSAHRGVQPPTPPDVPADGLLVQGAASQPVAPGAPGLGETPAQPVTVQALSALTFVVPAGSTVQSLTLKIAGEPPEATSVYACPVTGPYKPVQNGKFDDAPKYDCTTTATPVLDPVGGTLGFGSDIAGLVTKGSLSFVLLPGGADRVILEKPDAKALVLSQSSSTLGSSGTPAFDPGDSPALEAPTAGGPSFDSGSGEVPLGSDLGSGTAGAPSFGTGGPPEALGPEVANPQAAAAPVLGGPRTGPTTPTGAEGAVDSRTRIVLLLALLGVGGALMVSSRSHTAAPLAQAAPPPISPQERGIGRFRSMRETRAMPL